MEESEVFSWGLYGLEIRVEEFCFFVVDGTYGSEAFGERVRVGDEVEAAFVSFLTDFSQGAALENL